MSPFGGSLLAIVVLGAPAAGPPPPVALQTHAGGAWRLVLTDAERSELDAVVDVRADRALVLVARRSADFRSLAWSGAVFVDREGTTRAEARLPAHRPVAAAVAPGGERALLQAVPFPARKGGHALFLTEASGARALAIPADLEREVVLGGAWLVQADRAPFAPPPSAADSKASPRAEPADVVLLDRSDRAPQRPEIRGAVAPWGNGLVALHGGRLTAYGASLEPLGSIETSITVGRPVGDLSGRLVAIADTHAADERRERAVPLFGGGTKPTGTFTVRAAYGVELAVAPDGGAVLAAPAALSAGPSHITFETGPSVELTLASPGGSVRWRREIGRLHEREYLAGLSLADGGRRSAVLLRGETDEGPGRIVVLDERGGRVHEETRPASRIWLAPAGDALWVLETTALSRIPLPAAEPPAAPPGR